MKPKPLFVRESSALGCRKNPLDRTAEARTLEQDDAVVSRMIIHCNV
jgi:hypothetical protein